MYGTKVALYCVGNNESSYISFNIRVRCNKKSSSYLLQYRVHLKSIFFMCFQILDTFLREFNPSNNRHDDLTVLSPDRLKPFRAIFLSVG